MATATADDFLYIYIYIRLSILSISKLSYICKKRIHNIAKSHDFLDVATMWPLTISNHNCRQNLRCWKAPLTPRHSDVVHVQNLKQIQTSRIGLPVGQPYGAMQWVVAGSLSGCRSKSQNAPRTFDNFLELFQYFWLFFGGTEGGTTAPYCHCFPFQNCGWLVQRRCCSFAQRMERCGTKQEVIFRFLSVRASLKIDMLPTNASGCGTRKHWTSSKNYVVCLPATFVGPLTTQLHGKTLRALPVRVAA